MRTRNERLGLVLVLGGGVLLLGQLFGWQFGEILWPFFILVPGLLLLSAAFLGGKSLAPLFIPGSVITTLGLIFLVQNATDHFESWAYAWALMPAATGVGLFLQGRRLGRLELAAQGRRMAAIGGAAFVLGAIFFEGFIFGDFRNTWLFRIGLPLALVAAGTFLLLRRETGRPSNE